MAHPSDSWLLVLHGLRLKGFGEPADVAAITGVDETTVTAYLAKAAADGLVLRRDGARLSGWSLTADGRAAQESLLRSEVQLAMVEPGVRWAYERFLALNGDLLELCTDWQMRDATTLNDHTDATYDANVVARLRAHHDELDPILVALESALERYRGYRPRFEHALAALSAGDGDWFTKPMIDSYHTVWFQLHEDLLNTLGIERSKEAAS
ncbi:MAG: transcriptional regulator [Acidimicrobiales bacterium]